MTSTGLHGPHSLSKTKIDEVVLGIGPGAYALGEVTDGAFHVRYVGRSDEDLNKRLHKHIGAYSTFKYGFLETKQEAFEKECRLFHDFNPPDNVIHPARPEGTSFTCPVVGCPH